MSEGKSIYAYQARFADEHIVVRQIGFDPTSGRLALAIDENHEKVGFYYITVTFDSGNSTRIDYDGVSRLSWKWKGRSPVKITERTHEQTT